MKSSRFLCVAFVLLIAGIASATTFSSVPTDRELIDRSDAVVLATVRDAASRLRADGSIVTEYHLVVSEGLKGAIASKHVLLVSEFGGFAGGRGMFIEDSAVYQKGEQVMAFLRQRPDGSWYTTAMTLGHFTAGRNVRGEIILARDASDVAPHDPPRLQSEFAKYVRDIAHGLEPEARYESTYKPAADGLPVGNDGTPGQYALTATDPNSNVTHFVRWNCPSSCSVSFKVNGTQPGVANATTGISNGMAAWTNDPNAFITLNNSGTTGTSTFGNSSDLQNTIYLNNNETVTVGLCDQSQACTVGWLDGTTHSYRGDTFYSITEADILVRSVVSSSSQFNTLITHELGHSIGIRHSNQGTPSTSVAIMNSTVDTSLGQNLQQWDKDAVDEMYGNGAVCFPPAITSQSGNANVNSGSSTTLNVTASGSTPFTYQWYEGNAGDTSTPVGSSQNFTTPPITSTKKYWARVTNACGSADSTTITIGVNGTCTKPAITTDPQSVQIQSGASATLTVASSGTNPLNFQWYQGQKGDVTLPVGQNLPTFSTPPLTQSTTYWVRVSNSCGTADSNAATVAIAGTCAPPAFTVQPSSYTIPRAGLAVFTATATGTGVITYQWFKGTAPDTSTPLTGLAPSADTFVRRLYADFLHRQADAAGLATFVGLLGGGTPRGSVAQVLLTSAEYRSILLNDWFVRYVGRAPGAFDSTFYLGVFGTGATDEQIQASILASPEYFDTRGGGSVALWIDALYRDLLGRPSDAGAVAFWTGALASSSRQAVVLAILNSAEGRTGFITRVYNQLLHRTPTPGEVTSGLAQLSTLTDEQFMSGIAGSDEYFQAGSVLILDNVSTSTNVWVRASSASCGTINSNTATVSVAPCGPILSPQPGTVNVVSGGTGKLFVGVTGIGPFSYQWYRGSTHDTTQPIAGATSPILVTPPVYAPGNYNFWVRVIGSCGTVDSDAGTIVVTCGKPGAPIISAPPSSMKSNPYTVTWDGTTQVQGSFELQESKTFDFANPTTFQTQGNSKAIGPHSEVTVDTRFYYRVRSIASCNGQASDYSRVGSTLVLVPPPSTDRNPNYVTPDGNTQAIIGTFFIPGVSKSGKTADATSDSFTVAADQPWITVSPSTGALPPEGATVTLTIDPSTLPVGASTATLNVATTAGSGKTALASSTTTTPVSISKVTPVSPVPKDGNAGSSALIIPAVAHADGINTRFQSDVRLTNTGTSNMTYLIVFTPSGTDGTTSGKQTTLTVAPNETKALDDVVKLWFSGGSAGEPGIGTLEIRPQTAAVTPTTVASSRTYAVTPDGTLGQFIPAISLNSFLGKSAGNAKISLQQMAQSSAYRTNLGFVEGSGQNVTMQLQLFDGNGTLLKSVPFALRPFEQQQLGLPAVFGTSQTITDGRMEVKVTSDVGRVTAYASVLDNKTSDPLLVFPVQTDTVSSQRFVVPGVAELNNGAANFHTDMRIYNAGTSPVTTTLSYFPQSGTSPAPTTLTIAPGEVKPIDNTLLTLWNISGSGGSVLVTTAANSSMVVTARTFSRRDDGGTFGQFIPAVSPNDSVGNGERSLQVLQLEQSANFRSNVGLVETTGNPVTVEVTGIPADGKVTAKVQVGLGPNQFTQLNAVLAQMGFSTIYNARVNVRVVSGTGRVSSYGSVVDNRTQDPTYVPAQ